jgi:DNA-binding MarR family transcriptional regulator
MYNISEIPISMYLFGRQLKMGLKVQNKDLMLDIIILYTIQQNEYTVTDLSRIIATQASALSEKLIKLEQEGYISKKSKSDNRKRILSITEKGQKYYDILAQKMSEGFSQFFKALTAKEQQSLTKMMQKLIKH